MVIPVNDSSAEWDLDATGDFWRTRGNRVSRTADDLRYIYAAFLGPPIFAVGILGNLAVLFVLRQAKFKLPTYRYIFWLAIADLSHLTFDVLYMISTIKRIHMEFSYEISWLLCRALHPTIHTFGTWSSFMVVILTAHRLWAVSNPFTFRTQAVKTFAVAWGALFFSVAIHVMGSWQYEVLWEQTVDGVTRYACTWSAFHENSFIRDWYVSAREGVTRVLPVFAVFLMNIAITFKYRRSRAQGKVLQPAGGQRDIEEHRITNMLLFIGMSYVICMTPMSLLIIAMSIQRNDATLEFQVFWVSANILANTQSACNFYLYFFCSRAVRQEFLRLFWRGGFKSHPNGLSTASSRLSKTPVQVKN